MNLGILILLAAMILSAPFQSTPKWEAIPHNSPVSVGMLQAQPGSFPEQVEEATVLLYADDSFVCSAVAIAPNYLVTAAHCTEPPLVSFFMQAAPKKYSIRRYGNERLPVSVVARDRGKDTAILHSDMPLTRTVPLGDETQLKVGDPLISVGVPGGMAKIFLRCSLAALNPQFFSQNPSDRPEDNATMLVEMPVAPGQSGSGVYDEKQKALVGIVVEFFAIRDSGAVFAGVIPVSVVKTMIPKDMK